MDKLNHYNFEEIADTLLRLGSKSRAEIATRLYQRAEDYITKIFIKGITELNASDTEKLYKHMNKKSRFSGDHQVSTYLVHAMRDFSKLKSAAEKQDSADKKENVSTATNDGYTIAQMDSIMGKLDKYDLETHRQHLNNLACLLSEMGLKEGKVDKLCEDVCKALAKTSDSSSWTI